MSTRSTTTRTLTLRRGIADVEASRITAVLATPTRCLVRDGKTGRTIEEILVIRGAKFPDQVPLMEDHRHEVSAIVGTVRSIRIEGARLMGDLFFASDDESRRMFSRVRDGHIRTVSIGYHVDDSIEIAPGRSEFVDGTTYTAGKHPLRITRAFEVFEVSLVMRPADPLAIIQRPRAVAVSSSSHSRSDFPMPTAIHTRSHEGDCTRDALTAAVQMRTGLYVANERLADAGDRYVEYSLPRIARECNRLDGRNAADNDRDQVREALLAARSFSDLLETTANALVLDSYRDESDSTQGWCLETEGPSFRTVERFRLAQASRLTQHPRGGPPDQVSQDVDEAGTFAIRRFSQQFIADEQDLQDDRIDGIAQVFRDLGRAARRVRPDLVWSLLLANPTMPDGYSLFDADNHANYGTPAALAAGSLGTGIAAIGNQSQAGERGYPSTLNISGRFLVVPPDLVGTAAGVLNSMRLGSGDIALRMEARCGSVGCVDPNSPKTLRTGSTTNWFLFAGSQAPTAEVCYLDGIREPTVRRFQLEHGQWGAGFSVHLDVGVHLIGHRGAYMATGAGE